jgi:L-fucono-1,5-lactonase
MIDAHQHFIDAGRFRYPWLDPGADLARTPHGPDEYDRAKAGSAVQSITVQALDGAEETAWMLELAEVRPEILGVVGWVDLTAPDVSAQVAALRLLPGGDKLVGIRHLVHEETDPDWLARDDVIDLLLRAREMPAALNVVQLVGDLRFVVDHIAKPRISAGWDANRSWGALLGLLSEPPNVWCKLSGLITEAAPDWQIADLQPFAAHALSCFGADRVMFGSDWPVCLAAGTFPTVKNAAFALTDDLSAAERAAVFEGSALAAYQLTSTGVPA